MGFDRAFDFLHLTGFCNRQLLTDTNEGAIPRERVFIHDRFHTHPVIPGNSPDRVAGGDGVSGHKVLRLRRLHDLQGIPIV